MLNKRITFVFYFMICLGFLMVGCEDFLKPASEEEIDARAAIPLNTVITEGPEDGASLLFYSSPTIKWKGEIYPGFVAGFNWTMTMTKAPDTSIIAHSDGYTMEMLKSFPNLEAGRYDFKVTAMDDKDSIDATPDSIHFYVLASDVETAAIRFTQSPTDGSYRAPGNSVFFEWTASDPSTFGSIVSYSYRLAGTGASATSWSSADLSVTSAAITDLQLGVYSFVVKAMDNSGYEGVSSIDFEVKAPSVLVVDDYVPGTSSAFLDEIATDNIVATILRDWAWEEWDVAVEGAYPTATDISAGGYTSVIMYVDGNGGPFYYYSFSPDSAGYLDNPYDDFLDGGGNFWLIGDEAIYAAYLGLTSWGDLTATGDTVATADTILTEISGRMSKRPVVKGSVSMTDGSEVFTDDGAGNLINSSLDSVGTITYSSGRFTVGFTATMDSADVVIADYHHFYQYSNLFDSDQFFGEYLHVAGGGDASDEFTGLVSLGVTGFTEIGIPGLATGTGWPDELVPKTDATAIYEMGGAGVTTGILYNGTYKTVFWGVPFAFEATNHNHLTLAPDDMYPVANHVLGTVFGE